MAFDLGGISLEAVRSEQAKRAATRQARAVAQDADAIKERCQSLIGFVREAWHVLEPSRPYIEGFAIRAMAEHLEAVHFGQIKRLCMAVPPGLMKSLLTTVFYPAFEWGPQAKPSTRYLATSYNPDIVQRDTIKFQALIKSEWYQGLWGDRVSIAIPWTQSEANNRATGFRKGSTFESLTGLRANRVLVDDPLNVEMAESPRKRKKILRMFKETLPTRLDDPRKDAIVLIMQRLHEEDPAGYVKKHLSDIYTILELPMEYDPARHCTTMIGGKTWSDPRTVKGELLFPERFPASDIAETKKQMSDHAWAGQMQQLPGPREGGLFKLQWFDKRVAVVPAGSIFVRAWDFAGTERKTGGDPDATASCLMAKTPDGGFIICNAKQDWVDASDLESLVKAQAGADGREVRIRMPQDPAQAGKAQALAMVRALAGYQATAVTNSGDKERRATPLSSQFKAGNVAILETGDDSKDEWIKEFVEELVNFPGASHDDQVDAAADAFLELSGGGAGTGYLEFIRQERAVSQGKADAAQNSIETVIIMKPPTPVGSLYVMDGTRYNADARGLFLVAPCHREELERQGWGSA